MKQIVLPLLCLIAITSIMSFSKFQADFHGAIGDVKYSILPPDKFREENGIGWVLMDDRVQLEGSSLGRKHGIKTVPDVRGMFIRSLNVNRDPHYGDPYKFENTAQEERLVGSPQQSANLFHNHDVATVQNHLKVFSTLGWGGHTWGPVQQYAEVHVELNPNADNVVKGNPGGVIITVGKGESHYETRPKNIALYTYIKIND